MRWNSTQIVQQVLVLHCVLQRSFLYLVFTFFSDQPEWLVCISTAKWRFVNSCRAVLCGVVAKQIVWRSKVRSLSQWHLAFTLFLRTSVSQSSVRSSHDQPERLVSVEFLHCSASYGKFYQAVSSQCVVHQVLLHPPVVYCYASTLSSLARSNVLHAPTIDQLV